MGTTYHIKIVTGYATNVSGLKKKMEKRLDEINQSMSTYRKESEISRFNALRSTAERFHVSDDFLQVMKAAKRLHELTNGAWDGTLRPLLNLWGFGDSAHGNRIPEKERIDALLADIGFDQIEISEQGYLRKQNASISLDLASIVKGYGVDQLAELVQENGFANYLVEIGGEVVAGGSRKDGGDWRVGISVPRPDAAFDEVYQVVSLHDRAFATSGDYRNFFEADGKHYSHILDPVTGHPVTHRVVSVSVMADTCMLADGLATALMVMGHETGIALANQLDRVECLIIRRGEDGTFTNHYSKGFMN